MTRGTGTFCLGDAPAPRMFAEQFTASSPVAYSVTELATHPRDERGRFRKRRVEAGILTTPDLPANPVTNPGVLYRAGSAGLRILPPKRRRK